MTDITPTSPAGEQPAFDSHPTLDALRARPLSEHVYFTGGALKAYDDGVVGGYLVVFTGPQDRDSWNEYFTANTNFWPDWYKNQPVLYHHAQNDEAPIPIGIITSIDKDAKGLYARAVLDINHEDPTIRQYARRALDQVGRGQLYWSSGSISHMVRVTEDGEILAWPVVEGSLTPKPAETRGRTQVDVLRSAMKAFLEEHSPTPEEPATTQLTEPRAKEPVETRASNVRSLARGKRMVTAAKMDMAAIMSVLNGNKSLTPEQKWELANEMALADAGGTDMEGTPPATNAEPPATPPAEQPPLDPAMAGRSSAPLTTQDVERMIEQRMRTAPATPLPGGGGQNPATPAPRTPQVEVRSKYHDLSAEDMAFLDARRRVVAQRTGEPYLRDPIFLTETVEKTKKSLRGSGMKSLDRETANYLLAIKDNEVVNTQVAAAAGNWVPTLWTSELWPRVRVENNVARSFRTIEMPSNPYTVPIEDADPVVKKVPETTNRTQLTLDNTNNPIPESLLNAGKTLLTAAKLGLRVPFSAEEEEDSIIPFIPQLREQAMKAMLNAIDNVILNGDTATGASTNINDIAGTPDTADKFLVFDGLRKKALVTNTTMAVNAGGASPTLQLIRQARFKMQSSLNVYSLYPANLVMFCDPQTYGKILSIDVLNVWFNNGREATVNTGQVPMIDGVELYPSEQLIAANSDGKIDLDVPGNNTTGTLIIAARRGITVGYRRQVMTSVDFLPYYDSYQMVATTRLALAFQDTVASAVIYNIGL
jgi:hypothetical protein